MVGCSNHLLWFGIQSASDGASSRTRQYASKESTGAAKVRYGVVALGRTLFSAG